MQRLLFKGPVTTASGYGVHARQILKALVASNAFDISLKCIGWGNTSNLNDGTMFFSKMNELSDKYRKEQSLGNTDYDISIQVTIPNEFEKLAAVDIGITAGIEVDVCSPEWIKKINDSIDILFVPSNHSKEVFERSMFQDQHGNTLKLNKPVYLAHEGFNSSHFNLDPIKGHAEEFDTDFNFLFVGLGIKGVYGEERKNISNLVKWFCEAFKGRKDVGLVLKTAVVNNSLMDFNSTVRVLESIKNDAGCSEFPKVHLVHGRLSDEEMANLYKNPKIKAFVSLTHGEGFGLPLLEAAACGLPIIATDWSGHLDFLKSNPDERHFIPLSYEMKDVPESVIWKGVIEPGSKWASVDEQDVKLKLSKVEASYDKPKEWAGLLASVVHENFDEAFVTFNLINKIIELAAQFRSKSGITTSKIAFTEEDAGKKLLFTMPMSAGDVYISTAVVNSLKKKFPDHKIFFATQDKYKSILSGNQDIHKVIEHAEWMFNISDCEELFDEVYTPNMSIQMMFSNWVHGGNGRLLGNEIANNCNVDFGEYNIKMSGLDTISDLPERYLVLNPGSGKGQWEARNYTHWQELVTNLVRELGDIKIVQTGLQDDPLYDGCVDFRGKTRDYGALAAVIENSELVLGIDSVTMHLAAGLGVNHVALFGSSYPTSTGPVVKLRSSKDTSEPICSSILLEPGARRGCDKACYKYTCKVEKDYPCINEIHPETIYHHVLGTVFDMVASTYGNFVEVSPKISGYTHVFNAKSAGFPFVQSIKSMLGFCDEVIVVDGGSDDGTIEAINEIGDERIKLKTREWDWTLPTMDGQQKAYGRAMCTGDFLWQQDADEVVHERDYEKIKKLVKRFPKDCMLIHLPIIELWGDDETVRTDRHSWKWRLSRNDFKITHGVVKHARVIDPNTGKLHAKPGMSDGCEYINLMTNDYIEHKGFYTVQLDEIRKTDPATYGDLMHQVIDQLPSVYHYSWSDIPKKIRNFKSFWNKCWSNLYNEQTPTDRFPDVSAEDENSILDMAEKLKKQGGEHSYSPTFKLKAGVPAVMKEKNED